MLIRSKRRDAVSTVNDRALVSTTVHGDESLEVYRQLCVSLALPSDVQPIVIGVTSALSGEGRTTIAVNLARTIAEDMATPVTLVEVDLEHPSLARRYGLPPSPGLGEVLRGERTIDEVRTTVAENMSVIPAGAVGLNSAMLLRQLAVFDPFHSEGGLDGIVVLDLPPVIKHSYSVLAASVADAVVLVVRAGVTPVDLIREAINRLDQNPPQGVVFNAPRSSLPRWWPGGSGNGLNV